MTHQKPLQPRYDVVVVGGRCAGASTAMLLARAGARVLLIDRQAYGSDIVSTHALMRAGVLQLKRWGLLGRLLEAGTPRIDVTTFHYGAESIRIDIKPEHDVDHLIAPRRTVIDRILVDAAKEAGATVRHGVAVTDLATDANGRVCGVTLRDADDSLLTVACGIVIGADGRLSTVARRVKAANNVQGSHASGYVYGYYAGLPDDGTHWYFEHDTAAGVIPTNDAQHCVFVSVPCDSFAQVFRGDLEGGFLAMAAANSPALREAIEKATPMSRLRGFGGGAGYLRQCHGPGWALVGDAGYFKDPLTAHGITDALRDSEILSRAVISGSDQAMTRYQDERDTLSRPLLDVTDTIASFAWDLDEVKDHHLRLSEAMNIETNHVAGFSDQGEMAA